MVKYCSRVAPDRGEDEVLHLLFAVMGVMRAHFEDVVASFELTPPQAHALRLLEPDQPVPMRDLAEALHCDASNITGIVDRLERRRLVERQVSSVDRRVKTLVVTEEGRALREALFARLADGAPPAVALTARERSDLATLLAKVAAVGPDPHPSCIPPGLRGDGRR